VFIELTDYFIKDLRFMVLTGSTSSHSSGRSFFAAKALSRRLMAVMGKGYLGRQCEIAVKGLLSALQHAQTHFPPLFPSLYFSTSPAKER